MRFNLSAAKFGLTGLAIAGLSVVATPASAATIEESFDYGTGATNLGGQSGGTGWSDAWSSDANGDAGVTDPGFTDSRAPGGGAGSKATLAENDGTPGSGLTAATRSFSSSQSGTFWMSFIGQHTGARDSFAQFALKDTNGDNQFVINSNGDGAPWTIGLGGSFGSRVGDSSTESFLLSKIDTTNGTADMWVNPADVSSEGDLGSADSSFSGTINPLTEVELAASSEEVFDVDEINVGSSLSAVAVPTPGALPAGLALLGGMAMIRRRRKA